MKSEICIRKCFVGLLMFFYFNGFSQKKVVAINAFETTSKLVTVEQIRAIESNVIKAFYNTNRFEIVDRTNLEKLKEEMELQKSEEFMDGKTINQSGMLGAEQMVTGVVSNVKFELVKTETSSYYKCNIRYNLQVLDVETGQVLANESMYPRQNFGGALASAMIGSNSKSEAFYNTLKGMEKEINAFVGKYFPVVTHIIEVTEVSKDKAKKLLINTGNLDGAQKGQEFSVVELVKKKVGAKEIVRLVEIGRVKIMNVEGEEISVAKVVRGGEAILAKYNAGAKIECHSKN